MWSLSAWQALAVFWEWNSIPGRHCVWLVHYGWSFFSLLLYSPVSFVEKLAPSDSINIQSEKEVLLNMFFLCLVIEVISFQIISDATVLVKLCFFSDPRYSSLGTCIFQYLPHGIFAFLSSSQTLSSWRVERLNGSLSNICVQLRSNQAFQIPVSWRRGGENIREAVWASRRYFGICWMWTNERTVANRIQLAE